MTKMARKKSRYKKKQPKLFSWKRLKGRFQFGKKLRILGLAFLVVFSTLVTLAFLYLFKFIKQPFAQAGGGAPPLFSWSGRSPVNFAWLVVSSGSSGKLEEVAVLHLNPDKGRAVLIRLPPNTIPEGDSDVVSWLGALSRKLALPIRGYFLVDSSSLSEFDEVLDEGTNWAGWGFRMFPRLPSLFPILRKRLTTNLSLVEVFRAVRVLLSLREDQKIEVNWEEIKDATREFCSDERMKDEGAKILVLNGTYEVGLAARASRWIENLGGTVLDVGNAPRQDYERSVILALDFASYTVRSLASDFNISDLRDLGESIDWAKRADIVLILGLDKGDFF